MKRGMLDDIYDMYKKDKQKAREMLYDRIGVIIATVLKMNCLNVEITEDMKHDVFLLLDSKISIGKGVPLLNTWYGIKKHLSKTSNPFMSIPRKSKGGIDNSIKGVAISHIINGQRNPEDPSSGVLEKVNNKVIIDILNDIVVTHLTREQQIIINGKHLDPPAKITNRELMGLIRKQTGLSAKELKQEEKKALRTIREKFYDYYHNKTSRVGP